MIRAVVGAFSALAAWVLCCAVVGGMTGLQIDCTGGADAGTLGAALLAGIIGPIFLFPVTLGVMAIGTIGGLIQARRQKSRTEQPTDPPSF